MIPPILNVLQKITRERDVDSLESTLVVTLMETFHCNRVALYQVVNQDIEKSIELTIDDTGDYRLTFDGELIRNKELRAQIFQAEKPIYTQQGANHMAVLIPLIVDHRVVGAINLVSDQALENRAVELGIFIEIYRNYLAVLRDSERDKLTGLLNRRTFEQKLERLTTRQQKQYQLAGRETQQSGIHRSYNAHEAIWLAVVDVDYFKRVNDQYGHICGDEVLLTLSNLMRTSFRREDLLFRFGGEEFVLVLAPTSDLEAQKILERFRIITEETRFPLVENITVSIGFAAMTVNDYPLQVIEKADKALYYAKANGRNSVMQYEQLLAENKIKAVHSQQQTDVDLF